MQKTVADYTDLELVDAIFNARTQIKLMSSTITAAEDELARRISQQKMEKSKPSEQADPKTETQTLNPNP